MKSSATNTGMGEGFAPTTPRTVSLKELEMNKDIGWYLKGRRVYQVMNILDDSVADRYVGKLSAGSEPQLAHSNHPKTDKERIV